MRFESLLPPVFYAARAFLRREGWQSPIPSKEAQPKTPPRSARYHLPRNILLPLPCGKIIKKSLLGIFLVQIRTVSRSSGCRDTHINRVRHQPSFDLRGEVKLGRPEPGCVYSARCELRGGIQRALFLRLRCWDGALRSGTRGHRPAGGGCLRVEDFLRAA